MPFYRIARNPRTQYWIVFHKYLGEQTFKDLVMRMKAATTATEAQARR